MIFIFQQSLRGLKILIVANTNSFTRDNLVDLVKRRNNFEFIIGYIYKFKIF